MTGPRGTILGVVVMTALLALYLLLVGWRAVALLVTEEPIAVLFGAALLVLPVVGALGIAAELRFGLRSGRLVRRLEQEGGLPEREGKQEALASFPSFAAAAEHSDDWRDWLRLGLAYDAAGDRRRARRAVRHAIRLDA